MRKTAAVPIALSLMVLCLGTGWALAQTGSAGEEVSVRELFTPVFPAPLSAQSAQAERDREVVRSRFVHVNLDRLAEVIQFSGASASYDRDVHTLRDRL